MDMRLNPNYYFVDKPYKQKYICVVCRKSFKRRVLSDISKETDEKEPKCPECGKPTSWIGPKFRAPKSDNVNAWNSVKVLRDIGVLNYFGYASEKIKLPETKKALKEILINIKEEYKYYINKYVSLEYNKNNKIQIAYFADIIKKIEKHLKSL